MTFWANAPHMKAWPRFLQRLCGLIGHADRNYADKHCKCDRVDCDSCGPRIAENVMRDPGEPVPRCPTCQRYGWSNCSDSWHLQRKPLDFKDWLRGHRGITVNHSVTPHDWVELGQDYAKYCAQFFPAERQDGWVSLNTDQQHALEQMLEFCAGETGKAHKGYFGPSGWAYEQLKSALQAPPSAPTLREIAEKHGMGQETEADNLAFETELNLRSGRPSVPEWPKCGKCFHIHKFPKVCACDTGKGYRCECSAAPENRGKE